MIITGLSLSCLTMANCPMLLGLHITFCGWRDQYGSGMAVPAAAIACVYCCWSVCLWWYWLVWCCRILSECTIFCCLFCIRLATIHFKGSWDWIFYISLSPSSVFFSTLLRTVKLDSKFWCLDLNWNIFEIIEMGNHWSHWAIKINQKVQFIWHTKALVAQLSKFITKKPLFKNSWKSCCIISG